MSNNKKTKMTKSLTLILVFALASAFALHADVSKAAHITFDSSEQVELDLFINGNPGDVELYVIVGDVNGDDPDLVYFEFHNESNDYCSIEGIYFDDGSLLSISSIENHPSDPPTEDWTTLFTQGASPPDLPGGNTLNPPFVTTAGFLADSEAPVPTNGVEPGEWIEIIFRMQDGRTFDDVIAGLNSDPESEDSLRIGVHVIGLGESDLSFSAVNPEPATLVLLAMAAGMAVFFRKSPSRNIK